MNFSEYQMTTYREGFNVLLGDKIGSGQFRDVFECRFRSDMVVKVERDNGAYRTFHNVLEATFWNDCMETEKIKPWLAPVYHLSPDGYLLVQARCEPVRKEDLPKKLPAFLTDLKPSNFGIFDGRLVCVDYALTIKDIDTKPRKVKWND